MHSFYSSDTEELSIDWKCTSKVHMTLIQLVFFLMAWLLFHAQGDLDATAVKVDFDEEFSGAAIEGGEEALIPSAPVNKGPKPKREKKEPGEESLHSFLFVRKCVCSGH